MHQLGGQEGAGEWGTLAAEILLRLLPIKLCALPVLAGRGRFKGWLVQCPAVGRSVNSRAGACTAKRGIVSRTLGGRWARRLAFVQVCMDWSRVLRLPTSALPPRAVGPGDFLVPSDLLQGGVVPYPEPTDPIPR